LMEEIRVPRVGFKLTTLVMIGTDCIVSYISNHHTIMTTTAPTSTVKVRSFFCIYKFLFFWFVTYLYQFQDNKYLSFNKSQTKSRFFFY
jgi:hypothetical protein